jgi:hypothetical protein
MEQTRFIAACAGLILFHAPALAQNCAGVGTGRIPLIDMPPSSLYLGQFEGGLYPGASGAMPSQHLTAGLVRAAAIVPRNAAGEPHPRGKIVMISVGMSNTTQEFCSGTNTSCASFSFMGQAAAHPGVNHDTLVILDGARGAQPAANWTLPESPNYLRIRDEILTPRGLSEPQVQVVWVKQANPGPLRSLPNAEADAYQLLQHAAAIARALKVRYPNVQQVFFSNRIYAGYATATLNPEPYAYETGFSVKWLIEAQIRQHAAGGIPPTQHPFALAGNLNYEAPAAAPWLAWGPYLWADGLTPRSDGLTWLCTDFQSDGTHPAQGARQKVGAMLLDFFLNSPLSAPWFGAAASCYPNCDRSTIAPTLNIDDFTCFIDEFAAALALPPLHQVIHHANCDRSTSLPILNVDDFTCFINEFALGCR